MNDNASAYLIAAAAITGVCLGATVGHTTGSFWAAALASWGGDWLCLTIGILYMSRNEE